MSNRYRSAVLLSLFGATICLAQSASKPNPPPPVFSADDFPKTLKPLPLYAGAIPNSTGATDEEKTVDMGIITGIREVSVPTKIPKVTCGGNLTRFATFDIIPET